jgi:hypothetical protein
MLCWPYQLQLVKLVLLRKRCHLSSLSDFEKKNEPVAVTQILIIVCLFSVQVPLYKHIADLVGKSATTLPVPAITVINGGTHAGNSLPIQVFQLYM